MANTTVENLIDHLAGDSAITALVSDRIYIGHVPQQTATPYLYVAKRGEEAWDDLDVVAANPFRESFTVECWSSADSLYGTTGLQHLVRKRLQGRTGTFGSGTIQMAVVDDQDDDYVSRGNSGDNGLDYAALEITITNYWAALA